MGREVFGRSRNFFASREIFLPVENYFTGRELFLSVENFLPVEKFLADRGFFLVVEKFFSLSRGGVFPPPRTTFVGEETRDETLRTSAWVGSISIRYQSRSQSFVPLDQRSENESSGSNHFRHAP